MNSRGMTLAEVLVVVSIIGILAVAMSFSFIGWYGSYKTESAVKQVYADLTDARMRAMQMNRPYYADFNQPAPPAGTGRYRIAAGLDLDGDGYFGGAGDQPGVVASHDLLPEDTNPATPVTIYPKTILLEPQPLSPQILTWNNAPNSITFDKRGMISPLGTVCFTTRDTADPDYDCIEIGQTRINLGQLQTKLFDGGACNAANCRAK